MTLKDAIETLQGAETSQLDLIMVLLTLLTSRFGITQNDIVMALAMYVLERKKVEQLDPTEVGDSWDQTLKMMKKGGTA